MNEAEIQNTPVEEEAFTLTLDPDDFKDSDESVEDTTQPTEEEVSTPAETKEEEVDFSPLLKLVSEKAKYMDNKVEVGSIDDLINTFQKGLDYDRKTSKIQELENSEDRKYLEEKAKENDMTIPEYIKALKEYENSQKKLEENNEIERMVENGIDETIARKVVETNRIATELAAEKKRLEAEKQSIAQEKAAQAKKEAENNAFLEAYPNIKVEDIPKEVFIEAEKSNLLTAYQQYENNLLKKQIEQLKKDNSNEKSSVVKSTTEHGGVVTEKQDDFLKGFLG